MELIRLKLFDLDSERGTLLVRQGKGKKDRFVPIGERAAAWVEKYIREARLQLAADPDDGTLFLASRGEAINRDHLTWMVRSYVVRAKIGKSGACHLVLYLYSKKGFPWPRRGRTSERLLMLAIRLPHSVEKRLEKLARRTGRTKTYYAREAILEHLEDLEDLYLAEGALERIRSGEEKTIPLKGALKRHGLER